MKRASLLDYASLLAILFIIVLCFAIAPAPAESARDTAWREAGGAIALERFDVEGNIVLPDETGAYCDTDSDCAAKFGCDDLPCGGPQ